MSCIITQGVVSGDLEWMALSTFSTLARISQTCYLLSAFNYLSVSNFMHACIDISWRDHVLSEIMCSVVHDLPQPTLHIPIMLTQFPFLYNYPATHNACSKMFCRSQQ